MLADTDLFKVFRPSSASYSFVMTLIAILIHIDTDAITSGLLAITLQSDYQNQHVCSSQS